CRAGPPGSLPGQAAEQLREVRAGVDGLRRGRGRDADLGAEVGQVDRRLEGDLLPLRGGGEGNADTADVAVAVDVDVDRDGLDPDLPERLRRGCLLRLREDADDLRDVDDRAVVRRGRALDGCGPEI